MSSKLVRLLLNGEARLGMLRGEIVSVDGVELPVSSVDFLPPCIPSKLIYVGLNYAAHVDEIQLGPQNVEPLLFLKPPSALVGHEAIIEIPRGAGRIDYEGELAVVVGRRLRNCDSLAEADNAIAGYTISNDITAREFQRPDTQWTKAKCFDTFAPLGPALVSGIDPGNLRIQTRINGEVRQSGNTSDLLVGPAELVAYASSIMSLNPGDVISTGTPAGVGPITAGDTVEVEIDQLGTLRNYVKES